MQHEIMESLFCPVNRAVGHVHVHARVSFGLPCGCHPPPMVKIIRLPFRPLFFLFFSSLSSRLASFSTCDPGKERPLQMHTLGPPLLLSRGSPLLSCPAHSVILCDSPDRLVLSTLLQPLLLPSPCRQYPPLPS